MDLSTQKEAYCSFVSSQPEAGPALTAYVPLNAPRKVPWVRYGAIRRG